MKRSACVLVGLVVSAVAWAHGGAESPNRSIEASMVVTGTITVSANGSVQGYTIHDLDKLPPAARRIIQATVPRWQFLPIIESGKAVAAQAGMSLRLVADMIDEHRATVRVAGAAFGCDAGRARNLVPNECPAGSSVTYLERRPPQYPIDALQAGVGGEVFLVLQIDRKGHVSQAAVSQVNLFSLTNRAGHYRKVLAETSLRAARRWQFSIPTVGPDAAKDHWVVQVPVNYWVGPRGSAPAQHYGRWNAYVPGPVQDVPWAGADGAANGNVDAIAAGAPFMRDRRFVLKTALADDTGQS